MSTPSVEAPAPDTPAPISSRLLAWWDRHGRHDLPWQHERTPYRVWIAEIMLQQTQVAAVIPYFRQFTTRFPDLTALASASLDEVLHVWTGLGYYARARNLHLTAREVVAHHGGALPDSIDALSRLPGIGRSTAGAIAACAFGQRAAILDGNVRRVLARHRDIEGWPGTPAIAHRLWSIADAETPHERIADYTQAIMDLGATICRRQPLCEQCPIASDCGAHRRGRAHELPSRKLRRAWPTRERRMLIVRRADGDVLLERRPPTGLWGGLWSFPELDADAPIDAALARIGIASTPTVRALPPLAHAFTHFRLLATPLLIDIDRAPDTIGEDRCRWYRAGSSRIGVNRLVIRILEELPPCPKNAS